MRTVFSREMQNMAVMWARQPNKTDETEWNGWPKKRLEKYAKLSMTYLLCIHLAQWSRSNEQLSVHVKRDECAGTFRLLFHLLWFAFSYRLVFGALHCPTFLAEWCWLGVFSSFIQNEFEIRFVYNIFFLPFIRPLVDEKKHWMHRHP